MRLWAASSLLCVFLATGCASSMYGWGGYETSLYKHYKDPADQEQFARTLEKIIERGEQKGRVPPGIYAEYGYLLMVQGRAGEAVMFFEREKALWPESTHLMDVMIGNATFDGQKSETGGGETDENAGEEAGT